MGHGGQEIKYNIYMENIMFLCFNHVIKLHESIRFHVLSPNSPPPPKKNDLMVKGPLLVCV